MLLAALAAAILLVHNAERGSAAGSGAAQMAKLCAAERRLFQPGHFPSVSRGGGWPHVAPTPSDLGRQRRQQGLAEALEARETPLGG